MTPGLATGRRRLGLLTATALVVANMIGFGAFTTSGYTLEALGTPDRVVAAWSVAGLLALLGALCYGALAARISESGGEYLFLTETVHPAAGSAAGWVSLIAGFSAPIAAMGRTLEAYAPWRGGGSVEWPLLATGVIVIAGLLHGVRLRWGVNTQNLAVAVKLAMLVGFLLWTVPQVSRTPVAEAPPFELAAFGSQLVWISLSYSGWNAVVYLGGEVRHPRRNLPRAMLLGTLCVTALYLPLNAVFVYAAPPAELAGREDIAAAAAEAIGGAPLRGFVGAAVALAMVTSISSMVMAGPRVYARMADDGVFPRWFATRGEVPARAVWLQVALALVVLWTATLAQLIEYLGWTLAVSTALTVIGLMRLRLREGGRAVPIPGWPWVPALYVVGTLLLAAVMLQRSTMPWLGVVTLGAGAALHPAMRWLRRR